MTGRRLSKVAFVPVGMTEVNEVVIAGKGIKDLKRLEDLSGWTVYVLAGSSYVEHLRELNTWLQGKGGAWLTAPWHEKNSTNGRIFIT
jgi:hypothetical protein